MMSNKIKHFQLSAVFEPIWEMRDDKKRYETVYSKIFDGGPWSHTRVMKMATKINMNIYR